MAGYIRQSTFVDGDTITAALFNNEYNQLVNAFSNTSGHKHDGTTAEGPVIGLIGDAGETSPNNKVLIDTTNNYIEFYVEVSSAPVQQLYIADGAIIPVTDSDIDLGTTSLRFKDTYTDTVTTTGNVSIGGDLTVTGSATISGNLTFGDADTDSINLAAEIDSDIIPNTDGTYDLGSATKEWQDLYIDGTANIDSLVADTADINGGTIDGATIATSDITVGAGKTLDVSSGTLTLADDQISGDKVEGGTIAATTITDLTFGSLNDGTITITAFADEDDMSSNSATLVPTQQSVKAYVDSQVTAQDLDITTDSGTIAIDLDSETLTVSGGTGLDSSATGNAVTLAIDSTVTTLTGTQTLTNKTLTSPVINTGVSGTAFLDDDTFATASATTLASSESIKAYVDTTVAATNEVVEDSTPQLGGDLDLNSNDIIGTGNINNTGTITTDGLTVDGTNGAYTIGSTGNDFYYGRNGTNYHIANTTNGAFNFLTGASSANRLNIANNGDISFYEDTGTTAQMTWDASADALTFTNNTKAVFGAGSELEVYFDGFTAWFDNTDSVTKDTQIKVKDGGYISLKAGSDNMIQAAGNSNVSLYYDGSPKLATTSTGIDVTGTVVSDGLTVDGNARIEELGAIAKLTLERGGSQNNADSAAVDLIETNAGSEGANFGDAATNGFRLKLDGSANDFLIQSSASGTVRTRLGIDRDTGDISFYEDTGTTAKFFWDASAEALGIGTTSPTNTLEIASDTDNSGITIYNDYGSGGRNARIGFKSLNGYDASSVLAAVTASPDSSSNTATSLVFSTSGNNSISSAGLTERMRIDSSGNILVGTSSVTTSRLNIGGTSNYVLTNSGQANAAGIHVDGGTAGGSGAYSGAISFGTNTGASAIAGVQGSADSDVQGLAFIVHGSATGTDDATEAMRIDSSGNLLVGTTSTSASVAGGRIFSTGRLVTSVDDEGHYFRRNNTDGTIVEFAKNGSTVGSIGTASSIMYIGTGDVGIRTNSISDTIEPFNTSNTNVRDALIDLGSTGARWKDLYLSSQAIIEDDASSPSILVKAASQTSSTTPTASIILASGSLSSNASAPAIISYRDADYSIAALRSSGLKFQVTKSNAGSEAMRIDSDGNVGIGDNTFTAGKLRVYDTAGNHIWLKGRVSDGNASVSFRNNADNAYNGRIATDDTSMNFQVNGSERMRIDSSGQLRLGNTSPSWDTNFSSLVTKGGFVGSQSSSYIYSGQNVYHNGGLKYTTDGYSTLYEQSFGNHTFYNAVSGTANSAITYNTALKIDTSGNVGIGRTSISQPSSGATTLAIQGTDNNKAGAIRLYSADDSIAAYIYPDSVSGLSINTSTSHPMVFRTVGTERMRIDTSGTMILQADGAANLGRIQFSSQASTYQILGGNNIGYMGYKTGGYHRFFGSDGAEDMRIDSSGNLLVGATAQLSASKVLSSFNGATHNGYVAKTTYASTGSNFAVFLNSGNQVAGSINHNGTTSVAYNTSSDYRLKENVDYDFNALDRVAQLKPARFNFIADADTTVDGFLAHEVQDIVPEAISGEKDAVDDEGNPEYQGIDHSKLVPLLTKAIQEQQAQIEALQSEINLLKGE